jgi:hypothetical protein
MSWKTSLCGWLTLIGGAITMGISKGLINPAHFPAWLGDIAALLSLAGGAGVGIFARDNDKTSEQVNAGQPSSSPLKLTAFLLFALAVSLVTVESGCSSTPARTAYNVVEVGVTSVDEAMTVWGDYVAQFHPGVKAEQEVKDAFEKAKAAELAANSAAHTYADLVASGNTNSLLVRAEQELTSRTAQQALTDLVNAMRKFGATVKLKI